MKALKVIFILGFGLALIYFLLSDTEKNVVSIPDNQTEIDSLRIELQYYKDRERQFLDKNSKLYEQVSQLEQQVGKKPATIYIKTTKNEKNPLISTTESEYFNSLLSRRYQDKP